VIERLKNYKFLKKYYPNSFQSTSILGRLISIFIMVSRFILQLRYAFGFRELKKLQKTLKTEVLVIASGPSVLNITAQEYLIWKQKNNGVIIAINSYFKSELAQKLHADYYVLSDPFHRDWIINSETEFVKYLKSNPEIMLLIPKNFKPFLDKKIENVIFFNDTSLEGLTKNTNPVYPRGYLSLTAYKALAIAQYISTKKIFIIGFDNNLFRYLEVDSENNLIQAWNNFHYNINSYPKSKLDEYHNGASDYFFDIARAIFHLRFFDKKRIINLDPGSVVDIFHKLDERP
jgi:hypothetical protein